MWEESPVRMGADWTLSPILTPAICWQHKELAKRFQCFPVPPSVGLGTDLDINGQNKWNNIGTLIGTNIIVPWRKKYFEFDFHFEYHERPAGCGLGDMVPIFCYCTVSTRDMSVACHVKISPTRVYFEVTLYENGLKPHLNQYIGIEPSKH